MGLCCAANVNISSNLQSSYSVNSWNFSLFGCNNIRFMLVAQCLRGGEDLSAPPFELLLSIGMQIVELSHAVISMQQLNGIPGREGRKKKIAPGFHGKRGKGQLLCLCGLSPLISLRDAGLTLVANHPRPRANKRNQPPLRAVTICSYVMSCRPGHTRLRNQKRVHNKKVNRSPISSQRKKEKEIS